MHESNDHLADVAVPVAVRTPFTYLIPEELRGGIRVGQRVPVPLGRRRTHGYVVRLHGGPAPDKVRPLGAPDPVAPIFDAHLLDLTRWVSDYYMAPWGEVLEAAAPRGKGPRARRSAAGEKARSLGPLADPAPPDPDLMRAGSDLEPAGVDVPPILEAEQAEVFGRLRNAVAERSFSVHLIRGVPGSGKTEIYLAVADVVLREGGSVLLLEPEIGLATQILSRVRRRFGDRAGLYHSMTGPSERRRTWERARAGDIRIVVGARSAVFVPLPDLRLIIVDEEQEPAYKQEESPRYHGRDTAIVRARMARATVVLGSATPSLEAWWNAQSGKFVGHVLHRRFASREPASVTVVDLRDDPGLDRDSRALPLFSGILVQKIRARLLADEQTILFLNRRGHSTIVQCPDCGEMFRCRRCEVVMTYHRATSDLRCHHCGEIVQKPAFCPACKGTTLHYGGIGTQKLEEKIAELFPQARLLRLDADSTRRRGSHAAHISAIEEGKVDILIGTQMLAKGFDFPRVTLVGVLFADREMGLPEMRASERAIQLLTQVAGRAGRGRIPGEVVLQTLLRDHYVIRGAAAGDYEAFAKEEIAIRRGLGYPPFSRMVHLLYDGRVEATVEKRVEDTARALAPEARKAGVAILGPAPMFLSRLKGRYRWHITLKGAKSEPLHRLAGLAIDHPAPAGTRGVRLHVDVDPIHTL